MKLNIKAALALSGLLISTTSALAGGIEMPPPIRWDFHVGASGVAYGYEQRFNGMNLYSGAIAQGLLANAGADGSQLYQAFHAPRFISNYRDIALTGGFDLGIGLWVNRAYYGIEGRYDLGQWSAYNMISTRAGHKFTGPGDTATVPQTNEYDAGQFSLLARYKNNASVIAKFGWQTWRRCMPYILVGWAHTSLNYNYEIQMGMNSDTQESGRNANPRIGNFRGSSQSHSLDGGIVGFGFAHALGWGLSTFAEFTLSGYHLHQPIQGSDSQFINLLSLENGPSGNSANEGAIVTFTDQRLALNPRLISWKHNYYHYNLRVGINWNFLSLM